MCLCLNLLASFTHTFGGCIKLYYRIDHNKRHNKCDKDSQRDITDHNILKIRFLLDKTMTVKVVSIFCFRFDRWTGQRESWPDRGSAYNQSGKGSSHGVQQTIQISRNHNPTKKGKYDASEYWRSLVSLHLLCVKGTLRQYLTYSKLIDFFNNYY